MHLLIPFAAPPSDAGRQALAGLELPHLMSLTAAWTEAQRDEDDAWSLSPPHERALAEALGLQGGHGRLPWAASQAQADGIATGGLAWGLLTPVHWHIGTDQVSLLDPAALELDAASSRTLFDAVSGLFTSEGYAMHYGAPLRWYVAHDSLATLATASLDRVIGRNVERWLGTDPAARRIRRLQSEVQMMLHSHPLNDQREAQGLLPVNSFWLSGCGVAQAPRRAGPEVDPRLRGPALADDWAAWGQAWQTLDEGPLAALSSAPAADPPHRLTLCGERASVTFESASRRWLQRWRRRWSAPKLVDLMAGL